MVVGASDQAAGGGSEPDAAGEQAAGWAVASWASRSLSPAAQAFVRGLVAAAAPGTGARAKGLLFAAARLTGVGEGGAVGLELSAGVLLHGSVIERFILTGTGTLSPATRRTLRTNLRALARTVEPYRQPAPVALARERSLRPYSEAEIAGYLRLAGAQRTLARRIRTSALVCLGAGAGLVGAELRHLTGSDIVWRSGGLLVVVGGAQARTGPVRGRFSEPRA